MRSYELPLILLLTAVSAGCVEQFSGTAKCTECIDGKLQTNPVGTNGEWCTKTNAEVDLETQCQNGQLTDVNITSTLVPDYGQCDEVQPGSLQPTPATVSLLKSFSLLTRQHQSRPEADAITSVEDCSPGVTFTVIARNQNQDPDAPCDDARETRVVYEKYVGEFQVPEEVTLSAVIPAGGSHTFTVTDAYPSEDGSALYFYVIYQLYDFIPNEVCEPVPFEEGGMSRGFSNELREGGTLDITYLPPGSGSTFAYTITNPPSAATAKPKANETSRLVPIPDPKFARGR
jgi:hypothetical protein